MAIAASYLFYIYKIKNKVKKYCIISNIQINIQTFYNHLVILEEGDSCLSYKVFLYFLIGGDVKMDFYEMLPTDIHL